MTADVLVVGTGLIGTSVGLALRGLRDVALADADPAVLARAVARGAGRTLDDGEQARLVVLCTPLPALPGGLRAAQDRHPDAVVTHVGSVQTLPLRQAEQAGCDLARLCGGHPMAGRAESGPDAAEAALFAGRPWFVCPGPLTGDAAREAVRSLAVDVGASPVETTPERHDETVALVSHLPQVVASTLAAQLLLRPGDAAHAGPGLVDSTRLAGSPPQLWHDVLQANAAHVAPLLRRAAQDLLRVADDLDAAHDLAVTDDLLVRGNRGRALVPVKRGQHDHDLVPVRAVLPDTPGALAEVFRVAGEAGVNVEDVRVDHLPGRAQGSVELLVASAARGALEAALRDGGLVVEGLGGPAR